MAAPTRKILSRHRRAANIPFLMTERDLRLLEAVDRYRYLRTGQIHRLIFPECRSVQSARRRLKYLFHNRFLGRITPYIRPGEGSGETAYFLDRAGAELLRLQGIEPVTPPSTTQVGHAFLSHALDLSEFRVHLERALTRRPDITLKRFTSDFELKAVTKKAVRGKQNRLSAYKLYDEFTPPGAGPAAEKKRFFIYPDALIILEKQVAAKVFRQLLFLEIDRGTEPLTEIRKKVTGYHFYSALNIFRKFGEVDRFLVLFQTSSRRRAANVRDTLIGHKGAGLIWVTDVSRVTETTVLTEPIWQDENGNMRTVLVQPAS